LIFPVGLVTPFLTLIRGKPPHFVATGTVAVLQPSGQDDSLFTMCFARVQLGQEETRKEIMSVI
jgi:hypothetical protein